MNSPVVIVTGVGRTGTSAVARILHTTFEINMSQRPDTVLFQGYYEDDDFHLLNRGLTRDGLPLIVWERGVGLLEEDRRGQRWGFKDPRASECLGLYAQMWPDTLWIWCKRAWGPTLQSWVDHVGADEQLAIHEMRRRLKCLDNFFSEWPHLSIDMTRYQSDEDIVEQLDVPLYRGRLGSP